MAISDRHFAAQVRGGPKNRRSSSTTSAAPFTGSRISPGSTIRPRKSGWPIIRSGKWLDARTAHYVTGKTTPMAYGFGATGEAPPGSIGFEEVRKQLLAKDK